MSIATWEFESPPLHMVNVKNWRNSCASRAQKTCFMPRRSHESRLFEEEAEIAQLVEHNLAKVGVAGPSPVFRSFFYSGKTQTIL